MGILRKAISGTAAALTGGVSLGVVQFRSDTERGTRQVKKLRKAVEAANQGGQATYVNVPQVHTIALRGATDAVSLASQQETLVPTDLTAGWKPHPTIPFQEQFWNGSRWTSMERKK